MSIPERQVSLRDADQYDFNGTRDRIIDLRGRGYGPTAIAKTVGLPLSTVSRIISNEFQDRNASRQQIVEGHAQAVQWMKMKVTERIHDAGKLWDRRDAELLLKILEREAKVFGVDQPTQHQVQVQNEDVSEEELLQRLQAAAPQLFQQIVSTSPPKSLPEPVEDAEVVTNDPEQHARSSEETAGQDQHRERQGECGFAGRVSEESPD